MYHAHFSTDKANLYDRFAELIHKEFDVSIDKSDMERFRSWFKRVRRAMDDNYSSPVQVKQQEISPMMDAIRLEREKIKHERRELQKYYSSFGRTQLICDYIDEALQKMPKLDLEITPLSHIGTEQEGVLLLSDQHWGQIVKLEEVWPLKNEFNPEILKERMKKLADVVVGLCLKEGIKKIHVFLLGDELENDNLFANQVNNISDRVVDQLMQYGEFMSQWLSELSKHLKVELQIVPGNHTRLTEKRKDALKDNNWTRIAAFYIKSRLHGHKNITVHWADNELFIADVLGHKILGMHGHEVGNLDNALQEYSTMLGINFDMIVCGHYHSPSEREVHCKDVIVNGSLVGTNSFAMKIRKTSKASQKFFVVDKELGRTLTWNIKLN